MPRRPPKSTPFPTRRSSDLAAAVLGAGQAERVAQHPQQRRVGIDVDLDTPLLWVLRDRKSTRLNSSHSQISYAVFCLKKKNDFTMPSSQGEEIRTCDTSCCA